MLLDFKEVLLDPVDYIELCLKHKDIIPYDYDDFNLNNPIFSKNKYQNNWIDNYLHYHNDYLFIVKNHSIENNRLVERFLAINMVKDKVYFTNAEYGKTVNNRIKFFGRYEWRNVRPSFQRYIELYLSLTRMKEEYFLNKSHDKLFKLMVYYNNIGKYEEEHIVSKFMYKNNLLNHI